MWSTCLRLVRMNEGTSDIKGTLTYKSGLPCTVVIDFNNKHGIFLLKIQSLLPQGLDPVVLLMSGLPLLGANCYFDCGLDSLVGLSEELGF